MNKSFSLISNTHYNDFGLDLVADTNEVKVCLSKSSSGKAILQGLIIFSVAVLFVWHGVSTGYLLKINRGLSFLITLILLVAIVLPIALNAIRIKQVGEYVIKFNKVTRELDGNHFKKILWDDVDYFAIVSENLGEITPFEIQLVLKKGSRSNTQSLLVYASSLRLDRGKMNQVFSEFARIVGKALIS